MLKKFNGTENIKMAAKFQRKLSLRRKIMAKNEIFEVEYLDGEIIGNGMINTTNIVLLTCGIEDESE